MASTRLDEGAFGMMTEKDVLRYFSSCSFYDGQTKVANNPDALRWQVMLVLRCSIHFKDGFAPSKKMELKAIFDAYFARWGSHLGWGYDPLYPGGKLVAKRFGPLLVERLHQALDTASPNGEFEWHFAEADGPQHTGEYGIKCSVTPLWNPSRADGSFLDMWWPCEAVAEGNWSNGETSIHDFIRWTCERLDVVHGIAGFSLALPVYDSDLKDFELQGAEKYYCLDIDDPVQTFLSTGDGRGVKGVNWYTILGPGYAEKVGGEQALRSQLRDPVYQFFNLANDGLMIRIGEEPEMGPIEKGLPPHYVAVNAAIKPVRALRKDVYPFGQGGELGHPRFTVGLTELWFERFDAPGIWPAAPDAPQRNEDYRSDEYDESSD